MRDKILIQPLASGNYTEVTRTLKKSRKKYKTTDQANGQGIKMESELWRHFRCKKHSANGIGQRL